MMAEPAGPDLGMLETVEAFFGLDKPIATFEDLIGRFALAGLALGIVYNAWQGGKSFLLLRRMNGASKRGGILACLATIVAIFVRHPFAFFQPQWNIYVRTRMRVEHEIFDERPQWVWPPEAGEIAGSRVAAWWRTCFAFLGSRAAWAWRMAQIGVSQQIQIDNAGDVNAKFAEISRYFKVIESLSPFDPPKPSFACEVRIATGFVAPLHLLTGLLAQYKNSWESVISRFELHTCNWRDVPLNGRIEGSGQMAAEDFRQLQSFIFHCWLLWGPSIPICDKTCANWSGAYFTLQYGYGDENNSIEIVGDRDFLCQAFGDVVANFGNDHRIMAFPASVTGVLQYSSSVILEPGKFPQVLQTSWRGGQDARPVLYLSEGRSGDAVTGLRAAGERIVGSLLFDNSSRDPGAPVSRYYSAYLWIMFVLQRRDPQTGEWRPFDPDEGTHGHRSRQPWKGTVPFFEHGNIADRESCAFAKQVLADKVIAAIFEFARAWPKDEFPIRFAFSGAIDESTCGHPPLFAGSTGGRTIRSRIEDRLASLSEDSPLRRLSDEGIVVWDAFCSDSYRHPHSPCHLPLDIRRYYEYPETAGDANTMPEAGDTDQVIEPDAIVSG